MAGHSKWANIQHRKRGQDKKRGKLFTKLIKEISVAAKLGGADLESNPRLRAAVHKAYNNNMTKDNVERAIKRGVGSDEMSAMEQIRYEGYGPGGVAVIVECLTDNRNRTVAEVRYAFTKCNGNLGTDGSVSYLFTKRGLLNFAPGIDENRIMEVALEAGAEDVVNNEDGSIDVMTQPDDFMRVKESVEQSGLKLDNAEITLVASTSIKLNKDDAEKMIKLLDLLEDLDDVQNVYSNADIDESLLKTL